MSKRTIYVMMPLIIAVMIIGAITACEEPKEPAHNHQWGAWTVTKAANCTTKGVETRTCALDAAHIETRDIEIDTTAHNWGEWEGTVTCTTAGTGTRVCAFNGAHIETRNDLQPLGHNYEWTASTPATCTSTGVDTGICTHDNSHIITREVAALGHDWAYGT